MMHSWKEFLDSLATRGGTVFVLLLLVGGFGIAGTFVGFHAGSESKLFAYVAGIETGFVSALTLALTGGQRLANGTPKASEPPK
jgi:hypothetical protein